MSNIQVQKNKIIALSRLIDVAHRASGSAAYIISLLGTLAISVTNTDPTQLPTALAVIASGVGVNLLSNAIEKAALGNNIDDEELTVIIQKVLADTETIYSLSKNEVREELVYTSRFVTVEIISVLEEMNLTLARTIKENYDKGELFQNNVMRELECINDKLEYLFDESKNNVIPSNNKITNFINSLESRVNQLGVGIIKKKQVDETRKEVIILVEMIDGQKIFRVSFNEIYMNNLSAIVDSIVYRLTKEKE